MAFNRKFAKTLALVATLIATLLAVPVKGYAATGGFTTAEVSRVVPSTYSGAGQCQGYARYIGKRLSGVEPCGASSDGYGNVVAANPGWVKYSSIDAAGGLKPGDMIRISTPQGGHAAIVYSVGTGSDPVVTVTEKWGSNTTIHTGGNLNGSRSLRTISQIKRNAHVYYVLRWRGSAPASSSVNRDPLGYLDSATGSAGSVTVTGWAFDPDCPNQSLSVHIYIGQPPSVGHTTPDAVVQANLSSPDVSRVFGVGGNHRYSATIKTGKTGTLPVYAFAINAQGGNNSQLTNSPRTTSVSAAQKRVVSRAKHRNPLAAKAKKSVIVVSRSKVTKRAQKLASNVRITKRGKGSMTYSNASKNKAAKKFKVNAKTGKVVIPKGTKKGVYQVKVKVRAKGNSSYKSGSVTVTYWVVVA